MDFVAYIGAWALIVLCLAIADAVWRVSKAKADAIRAMRAKEPKR